MAQTDLMTETDHDPDDVPGRFSRWRVVRWVTILVGGILVVLALWQDPLYAERF